MERSVDIMCLVAKMQPEQLSLLCFTTGLKLVCIFTMLDGESRFGRRLSPVHIDRDIDPAYATDTRCVRGSRGSFEPGLPPSQEGLHVMFQLASCDPISLLPLSGI